MHSTQFRRLTAAHELLLLLLLLLQNGLSGEFTNS